MVTEYVDPVFLISSVQPEPKVAALGKLSVTALPIVVSSTVRTRSVDRTV